MQDLQCRALKVFCWCIHLLPVRMAGAIGAGLGRVLHTVLKRHRRIAFNNLTRVYPQRSRQWRKRIARRSFAELGRTLFEMPHVFLRSKEFLLSHIEIEGEDILRDALAEQGGAFIVAAHHSNWELEALAFSMLGYESTTIYHPMKNASLDQFIMQCRTRFGAQMQSRQAGLRWLPRALKHGHLIGVMIDQHMSQGIQVPFLGHLANTTSLPASFIQRKPTPVLGIALERHKHKFNFTLRIWDIPTPAATESKQADTFYIMKNINDSFAPIIHARPELWLWVHRRWLVLEEEQNIAKVIHGTP